MLRLLRLALWAAAVSSIALFAGLISMRLFYPLELDCIEGAIFDHVARLAHGQSIYVEPSLRFIPLAYMPLLMLFSSGLARVFGPALWEPRLVSVLAVALLCALMARAVWRETQDRLLATAGPAIYLFAFGRAGGCHDVGRPDSLMLALVFAGLTVLRDTSGQTGAVAAGLLLGLGFFAKQHAIWFALAACAHLALNDRRRLPALLATLVLAGGGTWFALSSWLGSWFQFFTLDIPRGWSIVSAGRIQNYLGDGLFGALGLLSVPVVCSLGLPQRLWRGPGALWLFAALAAVGTGLMATLDPSAYRHVLTPTVVAFAIAGPIAMQRLARQLAMEGRRRVAEAVPVALLLLQFLPLLYPIRTQMPRPHALAARAELLDRLRVLPGPVLMPYHGAYTTLAGKGPSLHIIPLDDIVRARGNALLARDPEFLTRLMRPLRAGPGRPTIVTDVPLEQSGPLWSAVAPGYRLADSLGALSRALVPVTGNKFTPTFIYVPADSGS